MFIKEVLHPLFEPVSKIKGIGTKTLEKINNLLGIFGDVDQKPIVGIVKPEVISSQRKYSVYKDLLYHFPVNYIDRTYSPKIDELINGKIATVEVKVLEHIAPPYSVRSRRNIPYKVICSDNTGFINITFFNAKGDWLKDKLPVGKKVFISGKVEIFKGEFTISHPDYIVKDLKQMPKFEPIYPLTAGLNNKYVSSLVKGVVVKAPQLPEWVDKYYKEQNTLPSWQDAVKVMHNPKSEFSFNYNNPARKRLAYDEILASQLALGLLKYKERNQKGICIKGDGRYREKLLSNLHFELTGAQNKALEDIYIDMEDDKRMLRLLQGDVGSGKTIVAVMGILNAIETGGKCALMAPTDILSQQHYKGIWNLLQKSGLLENINVEILTGRDKGNVKEEKLARLKAGQIDLLIGTHSLFQEGVEFNDLKLVVIDEQHRFGVHQRLALTSKGMNTDILTMSATPIPRTLTMTIYGDMDLSILDELPKGRKPIETFVMSVKKIESLVASLYKKIEQGEQVYWVCPLVEESLKLDLAAAESRYRALKDLFGEKIGLIHGKMKPNEKDSVMKEFSNPNGKIKLLISTTVIEVGVDVPNATIMVIEHSERFGLSQLHQLRGRIGRGEKQSSCILLYGDGLSENSKKRLSVMRESNDGFYIAEEDLKLRGAGEILGTKQSGLPSFKIADYEFDRELFKISKNDVKMILNNDLELKSDRGHALRVLLYLFEKDKDLYNILAG